MNPPAALPRICTSIGHSAGSGAFALAAASCEAGESLLELRLDLLDEPGTGPVLVRRILARHPETLLIATCRRKANGGSFEGSAQEQVAILGAAVAAGARLVDIEVESVEDSPGILDGLRARATTVVSYHNFSCTPALRSVVRRLDAARADVIKVATAVDRPTDNLRLLDICADRPNAVVSGMGETGTVSRLLSPLRGGLFAYASPDGASVDGVPPTAPGQTTASAARRLFRLAEGSLATKVFAIIGKPIGHSKSPLIHNRAFNATGLDGIYIPLLVEPGDVGDFMELMRSMPIAGASVTIPHKQAVIPYLDAIDPAAEGIGAVNTLFWKDGKLAGTNTDATGVSAPLGKRVRLDRSRVLVVGNGGAAKAAVVALRRAGSRVFVTGRNPARVESLARRHGADPVAFGSLGDRSFDVLIQSTPVGMLPDVDGTLFPGRIPADVVFDLVYNPLETALLRHARRQGKTVISGIEMFLEQAVAQFRIWTGLDAPRAVMRAAVLERRVK